MEIALRSTNHYLHHWRIALHDSWSIWLWCLATCVNGDWPEHGGTNQRGKRGGKGVGWQGRYSWSSRIYLMFRVCVGAGLSLSPLILFIYKGGKDRKTQIKEFKIHQGVPPKKRRGSGDKHSIGSPKINPREKSKTKQKHAPETYPFETSIIYEVISSQRSVRWKCCGIKRHLRYDLHLNCI